MRCSMVQYVAVRCRVLHRRLELVPQRAATCCMVLQCLAVLCCVLRCVASPIGCRATMPVLQCAAVCTLTMKSCHVQLAVSHMTTTHCNTLQHTAPHCTTLKRSCKSCHENRYLHESCHVCMNESYVTHFLFTYSERPVTCCIYIHVYINIYECVYIQVCTYTHAHFSTHICTQEK